MRDIVQEIIDYVAVLREEIDNPDHSQWESHLMSLLDDFGQQDENI